VAVVSQVSVIGGGRETDLKQASIKFRLNRNPVRPAAPATLQHVYTQAVLWTIYPVRCSATRLA
jgi:hypothetical protein